MQKHANRILSALLVLVMVLSMLPATVFATGETENVLKGWNLSLGENIGVKFTLNSADYTVTTTVGGVAVTPTISENVVTVNVAAAQMMDKISLTVKNGEQTVHTGEYTVRQYAETILTGEYDVEVKEMVQQMLNYGAAAQEYFGYKTGSLANDGYELEKQAELPTDVTASSITGSADGVSVYGMSLVFESKTAVRFYFAVNGDASAHTFMVGETAYKAVKKDGLYYVEVGNINPQDIDKQITVTVDGTLSVSYSPLNYIVRKANSAASSAKLVELVKAMYSYHIEAVEYQEYQKIAQLGHLSAHADKAPWKVSDEVTYFKAALNVSVPQEGDYSPLSEDAIKLVRGGVEYNVAIVGQNALVLDNSNAQCLIKLSNANLSGNLMPAQANDYLIIEGRFKYWAGNVVQISKTYVYFDGANVEVSTTVPVLPTTVEGGVMMKVDGYGWTGPEGDLIFKMNNTAPNGGYKPTSAGNIKLIRNGETYDIAYVGQNVINKDNDGWYTIPFWTIVNYKPMLANDILVIEGDFYQESTKTTLNVSKTYVLLKDGGAAEFSTEMPTLSTVIEAGTINAHASNGYNENALYFSMAANDAPNVNYRPSAESNIKLIRGGETYVVGHTLRDAITKASNDQYYFNFWVLDTYKPVVANDILVIEGGFTNADSKVTLNIAKSYILFHGDGTASFSTEMPTPTTAVDCGVMSEHADGNASEIYFTLAENIVPVDEELLYPYAGSVQLVSGSNTSTVNANIYKLDADMYYLELDGAELSDGSYLIVEGAFANADNGYTMVISKTYVLADGESLVYSETEPDLAIKGGMMQAYSENKWNSTSASAPGNLWFALDANDAPTGYYRPTDAANVKLIRNGETYAVGHNARDTIAKESTGRYIFEFWTIADYKPMVAGDILIVEGDFYQASTDTTLNISKTYVLLNADGSASYSDTEPPKSTVINAGLMIKLDNYGWTENNLYFQMAANDAPDNAGYQPTDAACIKVIRNGETINDAMVGQDVIYKANDTFYEVRFWTFVNTKPLQAGDIIVFEGDFYNAANDTILRITKTYALLNADGTVTFSDTEPSKSTVIDAGLMIKLDNYGWTENNLYFQMAANDAPDNAGYQPTDAACIKVIRNGETINDAMVGQDVIYKANDTFYEVRFWTFVNTKPLQAGDIIVFEGDFYNAANDTILRITKTYALLNADGTVTFSDTEPSKSTVIDAGLMIKLDGYGWTADNLYFQMAANDAPDNAGYQPTDASCIKVIRNGETINDAMVGQDVINKANDGWYNVAFWTFVNTKPLQAGDIIVFEGDFYNAANDTILRITKTYAQLNAGGTVTFFADSDMYINAGGMNAYTQGWFNNGFFFTMAANNAPAGSLTEDNGGDWTVEYTPSSAAVIKMIRDGVTTEIAMVDRGTITKLTDTVYYFRIDDWATPAINNKINLRDGDMLVIEGEFFGKSDTAAKGYTLNISKTYITFDSMETGTITFSAAADTEFGEVLLPSSNETLKIGVWNGSYHVFTNERLAELKAAGITKIMGIDPQWTGAEYGGLSGMLDRAAAYGIDVIVDMRGWDGTADYAWTNTAGEPVCYLQDVVNHPALLGFIMFDEPYTSKFDELAELKAKFDAVMPDNVLFFVNLYGSSAADSSLGIISYLQNYEEHYVQKFLDKLGVEVLSWDSYPLVDVDGMRTGYFENFEIMASKGVPLWYTMLSSGHSTTATYYETPTAADLRWQMAVAMTYGVQNIDHYVYASHEEDYSCMYDLNTGAVTDLYNDVKNVNNEYLAWDNIYMAYNWVGVAKHSANSNDAMLDKLNKCINIASYGVSQVESGENLLIGVFENNGNKAYMVTNAGSTTNTTVGDGKKYSAQDATVTLTLDAADYKCAAIIDNGEISYVAVNNNTVTLTVEAFEGVFVIPVLN